MVTPSPRLWASIPAFLLVGLASASAVADPPTLRHQADALGDVVVIGSTLAVDCSSQVPAPPSGTTVSCATQTNVDDTAPDLYWRDNLANATITPQQARTSATLELPAGAQVTYARLYWAALNVGNQPDTSVSLDFNGGPVSTVSADDSWVMSYGFSSHPDWYYYQSTADVTDYVSKWGAGDFRVADVDALPLTGVDVDRAFSAWTLVVFYENSGEELRNLALFDGFTSIDPGFPGQGSAEVTLSGFLVPPGFGAKMTAFTYEGDSVYTGDYFTFNGAKLSDAQNPIDNFFNGSRSYLGVPVSGAQDVPALTGAPGTMAGFDLDTADVTSLVHAGDSSGKVGAASDLDIFILGGFVTSITNKAPDFSDFEKTATDVNGGALLPGDIVEYELTSKNAGNDPAVGTLLVDPLDPGLEYVPGSIEVTGGANVGAKTDAKDSDQAEYDASTRTVSVRLGTGASGSAGGMVGVGEPVSIKFRVKVVASSGTIPNQGEIDAAGLSGVPQKTWLSDGDPLTPGDQPTTVTISECNSDADCPAAKPYCDPTTKTCRPCKDDSECSDPNLPACQDDGTCGVCSKTNTTKCPPNAPVCNTYTGKCSVCTTGSDGDATQCQSDPQGPVCVVGTDSQNHCGCKTDSDCGGPSSGKVCDTAVTETCIDGCRGTDGNGCPSGLVCTSKDSSIGQCVPADGTGGSGGAIPTATNDSGDPGGCGCFLPRSEPSSRAAFLGLLLGFGLLAFRRRAGAARPS